jgi:prepilin signal peptidase PulO-like enzyme (type II secretory pathway)
MLLLAAWPREALAAAALLLGLVIGSFLNVVIHRLPRGESLSHPGSHCPACGAPVHWYDNVPLLSFLWLGARCRGCRARISWRYPAVELATGLPASIVWRHGLHPIRRSGAPSPRRFSPAP